MFSADGRDIERKEKGGESPPFLLSDGPRDQQFSMEELPLRAFHDGDHGGFWNVPIAVKTNNGVYRIPSTIAVLFQCREQWFEVSHERLRLRFVRDTGHGCYLTWWRKPIEGSLETTVSRDALRRERGRLSRAKSLLSDGNVISDHISTLDGRGQSPLTSDAIWAEIRAILKRTAR